LRRSTTADQPRLVEEHDDECKRWLGPGTPQPEPTACIEVHGQLVGWIDADPSAAWLHAGEANVGYTVFPANRGQGYAARASLLLAEEMNEPGVRSGLLVIDLENHASLGVARAAGATLLSDRRMSQFPTSTVYGLTFANQSR
jgi:predicted acetyltransferase